MTTEIDPNDSEVHADIRIRTRRVSEVVRLRTKASLDWYKLLTVDYVLQYVCTLSWVCFFLFMSLACWIFWFAVITWLIVQLPQLYHSYKASRQTEPELLRLEFDRLAFRYLTILFILVAYQIHWYRDRRSEERGSHPKLWVRKLAFWDYLSRYFPISLILADEIRLQKSDLPRKQQQQPEANNGEVSAEFICNPALFPADQNYLVGYHPHGILGFGAFTNFATEATGFSKKFPGLTPWLTTLEMNFKAPFHRDMLQSFNIVVATYKGITYLLDPNQCGKRGNMVIVVLGGAPEALDSRPGKYVFHTNRRYGFFKLALMTGSALVPCVSFGEPNMYRQVRNPPGCLLRRWQDRFTDMATFSPPFFYARILAPYRTPVNTVVGAPIPVPLEPNPTRDQVAKLKEVYLEKLNQLFQKYKPIYDPDADDVEFF